MRFVSVSFRGISFVRQRHRTKQLWQEFSLLDKLTPLAELPPHCIAEEDSELQPPIFIRGWSIDVDSFAEKPRARGLEEYLFRRVFPPDWNAHKDPNTIVREKGLYRIGSSENYIRTVIEEDLSIRDLPVSKYTHVVWGRDTQFAVSLYDNYNVDDRPSLEDEHKIRDALGLTGESQWFPEASDFH